MVTHQALRASWCPSSPVGSQWTGLAAWRTAPGTTPAQVALTGVTWTPLTGVTWTPFTGVTGHMDITYRSHVSYGHHVQGSWTHGSHEHQVQGSWVTRTSRTGDIASMSRMDIIYRCHGSHGQHVHTWVASTTYMDHMDITYRGNRSHHSHEHTTLPQVPIIWFGLNC